jgi:L-rhamnose isomerase
VFIATDYFDASINRTAAWVIGVRSVREALLFALLQPEKQLKKLQDESDFTHLLALHEEMKIMPFSDVWEEYLRRENVPLNFMDAIDKYEKDVLSKR